MRKTMLLAASALAALIAQPLLAKDINLRLTAKEVMLPIDNKGTMQASWTYEGQVPGPVLRVTEGDRVTITLTNDAANKNSHSIDLHAARVDVRERRDLVLERCQAPVVPLALRGLWGSFFSRVEGSAMKRPFRRGMFSRIALVAGMPIPAGEATPARLQAAVVALRGEQR